MKYLLIASILLIFSANTLSQQTYTPLTPAPDKTPEEPQVETSGLTIPKDDGNGARLRMHEFYVHPRDRLTVNVSIPCGLETYDVKRKTFKGSANEYEVPYEIHQELLTFDHCDETKKDESKSLIVTFPASAITKFYLITSEGIKIESHSYVCEKTPPGIKLNSECKLESVEHKEEKKPSDPYIDRDPILGECVLFGNWKTREDVSLVDSVNGSNTIVKLKAGTQIKAVKGEIHSHPVPFIVTHDREGITRGSRIYRLNSIGEGYSRFWYKDKVYTLPTPYEYLDNCDGTMPGCWGYQEDKKDDLKSVYWIYFELPDGKAGWSKEQDKFEAAVGC